MAMNVEIDDSQITFDRSQGRIVFHFDKRVIMIRDFKKNSTGGLVFDSDEFAFLLNSLNLFFDKYVESN